MNRPHRNSIFNEQCEILSHQHLAGDQHILHLQAPLCARHAQAGQFAHIQVDLLRPLRRPISIMRVDPQQGRAEFLYKAVGEGTRLLASRQPGELLDILAPIGNPFTTTSSRALLIGGGVGMPPMIALAEQMKNQGLSSSLVILGSEVPFPFTARPSSMLVPGLPDGVIAAMPLLDDWGIPSRLASLQGYAGCHQGYVTDLARHWLLGLDEIARGEVTIYSCGPHPMLEAVARLANEFSLPCQVSLEEFMACGVGGCAGCTVPLKTPSGLAMKRVCVDGPVFDAQQVFPHNHD